MVKKAAAKGSAGRQQRRGLTRWYGGKDDASNSLIQASKQGPVRGSGDVGVEVLVVWRLDSSLDGVERVDEKVDGQSCKSTCLTSLELKDADVGSYQKNVSVGVV